MRIPTLDQGFIETDNKMDYVKIYEMDMEDCCYI